LARSNEQAQEAAAEQPELGFSLALGQVPEQVRALEQVPVPQQEQLQPTDPPVEELPARLTKLLHSSARLASSSCTLPAREQWSEQMLLPDFVALRA
jgi:hypothetical protein